MMVLEVDPNLVQPGWTALVVVVLLGVALFFLGRSMIRQFGRIDIPADDAAGSGTASDAAAAAGKSSTEDVRTPPIPDLRAPTPDVRRTTPPDQH